MSTHSQRSLPKNGIQIYFLFESRQAFESDAVTCSNPPFVIHYFLGEEGRPPFDETEGGQLGARPCLARLQDARMTLLCSEGPSAKVGLRTKCWWLFTVVGLRIKMGSRGLSFYLVVLMFPMLT